MHALQGAFVAKTNLLLFFMLIGLSSLVRAQDLHVLYVEQRPPETPAYGQDYAQTMAAYNQAQSEATAPLYTVQNYCHDQRFNTWVATQQSNIMPYKPIYVDVFGNPVSLITPMSTAIHMDLPPPYEFKMQSYQPPSTQFVELKVEQEHEDSDCGCCVQ